MVTLGELCRELISALNAHEIENARFEAELILEHTAGADRLKLLTSPELKVDDDAAKAARDLLTRRISGEPLQYLLGEWEFYGFPFKIGKGVLIPRQDTETLVEIAQEHLTENMLCADLCAGSGCIGISLSRLTGCRVHSYELSENAYRYLSDNIKLNNVGALVQPILADVLSEETAMKAPEYDVIVTNPPYLTPSDMRQLQREVSFEPEMALLGGDDGLEFYRGILRLWSKRLKKGGFIAAEIGMGQENDVMHIFEENGIKAEVQKDYCGIYRVVYGIKS
ncbi:MAG: peptide chain release factor N(5)-glutamine methyltransferase [Ruminococcaceae bacterium]|nr:peptide chain release factor N(5)-glutamine methyltransferase [Oscillospiraceae bacterium]